LVRFDDGLIRHAEPALPASLDVVIGFAVLTTAGWLRLAGEERIH
jgi:hypothetical protein